MTEARNSNDTRYKPWQGGTPVEVLHEIFTWLSTCAANETRSRALFPTWLRPIHVCRFWRSAAMSCPSLWRYLPLERRQLTEMALKLSGERTITIDIQRGLLDDNDDSNMTEEDSLTCVLAFDALELAIQNLHRVGRLTMPFDTNGMLIPNIEESHFKFPASLIHLELWSRCSDDVSALDETQFHPASIEHLQTFRLASPFSYIHVATTLLSCMTSLRTLEVYCVRPVWLSLSQVFETLRRMPMMENLALLGSALPRRGTLDPGPGGETGQVHLQHLAKLALEGNEVSTSRFLEHVTMPICQDISVTLDHGIENDILHHLDLDPDLFDADHEVEWDESIPSICQALVLAFGQRQSGNYPLLRLAIAGTQGHTPNWIHYLGELYRTLMKFPFLCRLSLTIYAEKIYTSSDDTPPLFLSHLTHLSLSGSIMPLCSLNRIIQTSPSVYKAISLSFPSSPNRLSEDVEGICDSVRQLISLPTSTSRRFSYQSLYIVSGEVCDYSRIVATWPIDLSRASQDSHLPFIVDLCLSGGSYRGRPDLCPLVLTRVLQIVPLASVESVHLAHRIVGDRGVFDALALPMRSARSLTLRYAREFPPGIVSEALRIALSARLQDITLVDLRDEDILDELTHIPEFMPAGRAIPLMIRIERCTSGEDLRDVLQRKPDITVQWDRLDQFAMQESWRVAERPWVAPFDRRTEFRRDEDVWAPRQGVCTQY